MDEVEKSSFLKNQLEELKPLDRAQELRIMQKFRLDWNYHSNHIEGNSLTYGETKALLLFGITAQGKPLKDHFEITGHNEAIEWIMDVVKGDYPLTEAFIRELHSLLLKAPYVVEAVTAEGHPTTKKIEIGKYKTSPNHVKTVTGEIFYFATPEETPVLMHELIDWYREKIQEVDANPILLAAEFHYKFIRIHPFDDGNGRTARILMNFILMKFGFPPVIIKTEDKANYFSVLRQADSGIFSPFLYFIAENLNRSLEVLIKGARGENINEVDDLDKELFLLEARFRKNGDIAKSDDSVLELFNITVLPLFRRLTEVVQKFYRFYKRNTVNYVVDEKSFAAIENFSSYVYDTNSTRSTGFDFTCFHEDFFDTDYDESSYYVTCSIKLKNHSYQIMVGNRNVFESLYGDHLTSEELEKLISDVAEQHKSELSSKLKKS